LTLDVAISFNYAPALSLIRSTVLFAQKWHFIYYKVIYNSYEIRASFSTHDLMCLILDRHWVSLHILFYSKGV